MAGRVVRLEGATAAASLQKLDDKDAVLALMKRLADDVWFNTLANYGGNGDSSKEAALAALDPIRPSAVVAWPVDLPHVRVATLERLLEAHRRTGAPAVVPSFAERRGQPVIWDEALFPELATSEAATRHGAGAVLAAHEQDVVTVTVDDPAVIEDLNTPEDYERLVRELNRDIY